MLRLDGISSGLNTTEIIAELVGRQQAPLAARIARTESAAKLELSGVGQLKSALEAFKTQLEKMDEADKLTPRSHSVTGESVLSASVSSTAPEGVYTFFVDQLASNHQLITEPMAVSDTVGTGIARFTVDGQSFTVALTTGSLTELRDAINNADDNVGVNAAIVNDGGQQRLMLSSQNTGVDSRITADFRGLFGGTRTLGTNLSDRQFAADAMSHRLMSDAIATTDTIGTGNATFTVNGQSFSIALATGSLTELRDSINSAADNTGAERITASLVNDGGQERLMLMSDTGGSAYAITTDFSGLTGGSTTIGTMTEVLPARDSVNHELVSQPMSSSDTVGTGTASFTVNGQSFSVSLTSGSLTELRNEINGAAGNTGTEKITATIETVGGQEQLVLRSDTAGSAYTIIADFSALAGGSVPLGSLTQLEEARDASIRFGSGASAVTLSSVDNTLENVIDGVTLTLKATSANPQTLEVNRDSGALKTLVEGFVSAWNTLESKFDTLTAFNGKDSPSGPLNGDAQTRTLMNQLRRQFGLPFGADGDNVRTLGDMGLSFTSDGQLTLNASQLDLAISSSYEQVVAAFAQPEPTASNPETGLVHRLAAVLDPYLGSSGSLKSRETTINEKLTKVADDKEALEVRMAQIREQYQKQFAAMESLLASLKGTSDWLTNNLQNLGQSRR